MLEKLWLMSVQFMTVQRRIRTLSEIELHVTVWQGNQLHSACVLRTWVKLNLEVMD